MKRVFHYQRKRWPGGNHSIETLFEKLRLRLAGEADLRVRVAPVRSKGLLRRIMILFDVWRLRGESIHVTGDINFAVLGTRYRTSILTIHDCGFVHRTSGIRRWILRKLWLEWPLLWAKSVTTVSKETALDISSLTGRQWPNLVIITNSISEKFVLSERRFDRECPRILHVGTAQNKNLLRHVAAISGLSCTLVIVGSLDNECIKALVDRRVAYENHVDLSESEVVELYASCDMLLFASEFEGFGMPILESQAVGRPVITSNISSMPEVAGEGALLVNPFDTNEIRAAVIRIIEDESLRKELVSKGLENVKRFNGQTIAKQYLRLYEEVWGVC